MTITRRIASLAVVPAVMALAGCASLYSEQNAADMRRRAELDGMKTDLERLRARVEGMAGAQEELFRKVEAAQAAASQARQDQDRRIDDVAREVKAAAAAREQLRREIVDALSVKIAEIVKPQQRPPPARTQRGYEHTVEPGQTLSAIAAAYKVSVQAIVDANGLKSADQVKAGQRLFIPE